MNKILKTNLKIKSSLTKSDSLFLNLIEKYGDLEVTVAKDYYEFLLSSIIGQQLSGKVADVIWRRFAEFYGEVISPEFVLNTGNDELRNLGISYSKINYLKNLSEFVVSGKINLNNLDILSDEEIIEKLTAVKGIGNWTAQMFLIFALGREDVFSVGDGGLQRAVKMLYKMEEIPSKQELIQISSKWSPYKSYASLYLWKSLENN